MERVERDAWLDIFAAAPGALGARASTHAKLTNAYAAIGFRDQPGSEFNRCLGLGVDAPFAKVDADRAVKWLDENAGPDFAVQVPPSDSAERIAGWLRAKGLEPAGTGWARHFRRAEDLLESPAPVDIVVREVTPVDHADFRQAIVEGFGFPAAVGNWLASLAGRARWRLYVAYCGDVPAACGALYLKGGWGWLGCDATAPGYRNRGAQSALIRRRIVDAMAGGATLLAAETAQPAPGQEANAQSFRNYRKAGFVQAYTRPNFRRPRG